MFVVLIVVCAVNLVLLAATCALLNYISKRRGRADHTACSKECCCKDVEKEAASAKSLVRAGYSCVTLGSQGVYVMPSHLEPTSICTPFASTRKSHEGSNSINASFTGSIDSFGVTLDGILALSAQLEAIHRQTGEQRTSTKVSTDLDAALDQVLDKQGQGSSFTSNGSQESGYVSGFNSEEEIRS